MPNPNKINSENRFNTAPTINAPRSKFNIPFNVRTTFNAGLLIPFYVDSDIMPGDTTKIHGTFVIRSLTPIYPTMDNANADIFGVFVPHRLVWNHWKEFWGENETGAWTQQVQYQVPQYQICRTGYSEPVAKGQTIQYMGIPILASTSTGIKISALPVRAYIKSWNDWWRDENFAAPYRLYTGDSDNIHSSTAAPWGTYAATEADSRKIIRTPAPVYKVKDYFSSCLPEPQKGNPITLPLGTTAPVVLNSYDATYDLITTGFDSTTNGKEAYISTTGGANTIAYNNGTATNTGMKLEVNLANAVAATINAQRFAFAAQRILEREARTGSRYIEIIHAAFGVTSPDARQQRSEIIFAKRVPINITQVTQTSSTDTVSPQGNVAGYSLTIDSDLLGTKSFTEHGTLLLLICVRQEQHTYDSGINRMWSRKNKLDFYQKEMAFLGEQAVLNKEIYAQGTAQDEEVFGYNERWAELRYKPSLNTGEMSTKYAQSLKAWHYGDEYASLPVLSDAWRRETDQFIGRTLAVQNHDQFFMDCRINLEMTRCIPSVSIPGLMDHY